MDITKYKKIPVADGNNCKGCVLQSGWKCFRESKKIVQCWDYENDYIFTEVK